MATQRDLMRQKVNVSPELIAYWEKCMDFNLRQIINRWLIKKEERGQSFEYQGRTFTLIGMTENEHCMLSETIDGVTAYWEATPHFVQMCMGKFYFEWVKLPNGLTTTRTKNYETNRLYLPSHKATRKKKQEDPEPEEEYVDYNEEYTTESFVEDTYDDESSED